MFESFGVLNFWTYMAGLIFIIIVPGPNSLYVLKSSTSHGTQAGYRAALGVFTGDAILIFLIYWGCVSDKSVTYTFYGRKVFRRGVPVVLRLQNSLCDF